MRAQLPEDQLARLQNALFEGQKLLAIKLYREFTGVGLAEAKNAAEELEAELRKVSPEKFSPGSDAKGCRKTAVLICLITAGGSYGFANGKGQFQVPGSFRAASFPFA